MTEALKAWTCEICGQVVEQRENGRTLHPVQVFKACKLRDHYVGDYRGECIAYHDLPAARELAKWGRS